MTYNSILVTSTCDFYLFSIYRHLSEKNSEFALIYMYIKKKRGRKKSEWKIWISCDGRWKINSTVLLCSAYSGCMLGPTCELFETVYECQRLVEKFYKLIDSTEVTGLSVEFIGDHGVGYILWQTLTPFDRSHCCHIRRRLAVRIILAINVSSGCML